jgi:predicted lipoprotein
MLLNQTVFPRLGACIALLGFLSLAGGCTVVKQKAATGKESPKEIGSSSQTEFDAKAFVGKNWETMTIPELEKGAGELTEVLAALKADQSAAETKYGKRKADDLPYGFVVKGSALVREVRTTSAAGTALLDVRGSAVPGEILLQIGPVIKSSAVRDSLDYVNFGDFTNQTDYANISREINVVIRDKVVSPIDKSSLVGKMVTVLGVMAYEPDGPVLITPVRLTVVE